MDIKRVIQSQYLASLKMLKKAIEACPPSVWDDPQDKLKVWNKAYHVLFSAHFYLQDSEEDFVEWEKHHDPDGGVPFTKEEVLEYREFVEQQVMVRVPVTDLEAASGFSWYPVNKLEMHFINIRHIQEHTGEIYETLGMRENAELPWVGYTKSVSDLP